MSKRQVRKEFEDELAVWLAANGNLPAAYENRPFKDQTPPAGEHIRVWMITADTVASTWCGEELKGYFLVEIFVKQGTNAARAEQLSESLAAHFPDGKRLGRTRIYGPPHEDDGENIKPYFRIPVRIRYFFD